MGRRAVSCGFRMRPRQLHTSLGAWSGAARSGNLSRALSSAPAQTRGPEPRLDTSLRKVFQRERQLSGGGVGQVLGAGLCKGLEAEGTAVGALGWRASTPAAEGPASCPVGSGLGSGS